MDMDWTQVLLFFAGGALNGFVTVLTLRNDMSWIKKIVDQHGKRIYNLESAACQIVEHVRKETT